jgi:hypothetical protein
MLNNYQMLSDEWVSSFTKGNLHSGRVFVKCITFVYYRNIYFTMTQDKCYKFNRHVIYFNAK